MNDVHGMVCNCGEGAMISCPCMNAKKPDFRVFNEPSVKLVAKTTYGDMEILEWCNERGILYDTDAEEDADALSEFGGRLCYFSFASQLRSKHDPGKQNETYLERTVRQEGHGSITEHPFFTFIIDDVSRNMTHELVRHRVGVAYSQTSTRYVDQFSHEYFGDSGHSIGIYIPPEIQSDGELYASFIGVWEQVFQAYTKAFAKLRSKGLPKKDARSIARHILPGSAGTAILFTVNARELNHIFSMRGALGAEGEIRRMTIKLFHLVSDCNLFKHWEVRTDPIKGKYLHNTDKDKPKFKDLAEAIEYMRTQYGMNL